MLADLPPLRSPHTRRVVVSTVAFTGRKGNMSKEHIEFIKSLGLKYIKSPSFRSPKFMPGTDPVLPMIHVDGTESYAMSTEEERTMFLRYNYCKMKVLKCLGQGDDNGTEHWYARYMHYREYIARCNTALVYAMHKRYYAYLDPDDALSEGNLALIRAMEGFNVARGFKFSTYACRSISKAYYRLAQKIKKEAVNVTTYSSVLVSRNIEARVSPIDSSKTYHDAATDERTAEDETYLIEVMREVLDKNICDLTEQEKLVLKERYGFNGGVDHNTHRGLKTLDQVGKVLGVTKERVRQIQNSGLRKLHTVMQNMMA
jgi:RNA polymerase sigma factor (sigma-70 family)